MYWILNCGTNLAIMRTKLEHASRHQFMAFEKRTLNHNWSLSSRSWQTDNHCLRVVKVAHAYSYMSRLMSSIFFNIPVSTRKGTRKTRSDCNNSKIDYATTSGKEKKETVKYSILQGCTYKKHLLKRKGEQRKFWKINCEGFMTAITE